MELLTPLEQLVVNDHIKKCREKGRKQGLRQGRREGLQEGLEHGLEQGRAEGAVWLLERQLEQRFGPLPKTARNRLAKASVAQLEAWSDALVAAQSLRQVFASSP